MSQFTFTPAEDLLVLGAVRAKAAQYASAMGVADPALEALMAKIEEQFTPVVEAVPVVEEPAAVVAFLNDEPHEQFTHEEDKEPEVE
jgi:hypothetical protein